MDQLKTIFRALGTPTEEEWPVRFFFLLSLSFPPPPFFILALFFSCLPKHNQIITFFSSFLF